MGKLRSLLLCLSIVTVAGAIAPALAQSISEPVAGSGDPAVASTINATTTPVVGGRDHSRPAVVAQRAVLDFDGDNKTDLTLIRNVGGNATWYTLGSTAGFTATSWGLSGFDYYVPADYDGDGKWDVAVWRQSNATFYILQSATNSLRIAPFGAVNDYVTLSQDYDGDGKADPTAVRPSGTTWVWYILRSTLGPIGISFGDRNADNPTRGDFDGDGKGDIAVYRGNTGAPANTFFVLPSGGGPVRSQTLGNYQLDYYFPADFDGDGKTDYAVFRHGNAPDRNYWYWIRSSDGVFAAQSFGNALSDFIIPGDYDGDGKTDQAVWRTTGTPTFYLLGSATGFKATVFGLTNDEPVAYSLQIGS